jgi:ABC-type nickel/cobalt efflux system permease component RcnA
MRRSAILCRILALLALAAASFAVRADTVASLLGNFTINQYSGVRLSEQVVDVRHTVVFGQLPALRELHLADADGDGVTTQGERDAYAKQLASTFAGQLRVTVDGEPVPLRAVRWTTSLPTEQGGFSLRLDIDLEGALPAARTTRSLTFDNGVHAGRFGWNEIVVTAAPGVAVFDTNAFDTSLTEGLTESVQELPPDGPPAERAIRLAYRIGEAPAGVTLIGPRPGALSRAAPAEARDADASWLSRETRRLVDLISTPETAPHVAILAFLAAMLLGALHSFSPGHGKTVVGAYLIGSRATARHAVFLGFTVTVTHTIGVFALGFATWLASAYILPERIFPILGFVSGLLVLGMGAILAVQRWPAARDALRGRFARRISAGGFRMLATASPARSGGYVMAKVGHTHDASGWHSHGGSWHSHAPPEAVSWRSLLALGISGGLVPCPSAMVLLLAAVALNKTAFGLVLVVAFSLGLAITLTAIGFVFLYARNRIPSGASAPRWTRIVPLASAAAITLVGVLLCYGALSGTQV